MEALGNLFKLAGSASVGARGRATSLTVGLLIFCLTLGTKNSGTDAAPTQSQETNYYRILGIPPNANAAQIKKAYHKMSLKYHPDKNKEEGAEDIFMKIAEAYEVLSDEERRRTYDNSGSGDKAPNTDSGEPKKSQTSHEPVDMHLKFSGGDFKFNFKPPETAKATKAPDIMVVVDVELLDLYKGSEFNVSFTRQEICHHCNGSGAEHKHDVLSCPFCHGTGERCTIASHNRDPLGKFWQELKTTCDKCSGSGVHINRTCSVCGGQKVAFTTVNKTVFVPPGAADTFNIQLPEEGDQYPHMHAGNLLISLRVTKHPVFTRKDQDLYMKANITLFEALLGFVMNVTHIDNHTVEIKHEAVSQPGFSKTIENEGMPIMNGGGAYGDLVIMFDVEFPKRLDDHERELLRTVLDQEAIDRIQRIIHDRAVKENLETLNRPLGHDLRPRSGYETFQFVNMVDETIRLRYNGMLVEWNFVAASPGTIALQVWRPAPEGFSGLDGGENWYTLMGESLVDVEQVGLVRVPLQPHAFIMCEVGDVIGWRIDGGDAVLSYDPFDQGRVRISKHPLPRPAVGRTEYFPYAIGRTYPVQAKVVSMVMLYESRACSGERLELIDSDNDLCPMKYLTGEGVNDRVRSVSIPGGIQIALYEDCGGPGPAQQHIDHRAEAETKCVDLPWTYRASHVKIYRS